MISPRRKNCANLSVGFHHLHWQQPLTVLQEKYYYIFFSFHDSFVLDATLALLVSTLNIGSIYLFRWLV